MVLHYERFQLQVKDLISSLYNACVKRVLKIGSLKIVIQRVNGVVKNNHE